MILTHGRAGRVVTEKTLRECGWTGPVHYVVDDGDDQIEDYRRLYGVDRVHVFSKAEENALYDAGDLSSDMGTIVYARNASQRIAADLGWDYLWQLDDDYTSFEYWYPRGSRLAVEKVRSLDNVVGFMMEFMESTGALTVALGQGGDLIGGNNANFKKGLLRKAMNSFLIRTNRPVNFVGRINEDVNTYVSLGNRGELIFTFMDVTLVQKQTQSNQGGMTNTYKASGTYIKSFHTVMRNPSSVTVSMLYSKHERIHHNIIWNNTVPCIIHEKNRK